MVFLYENKKIITYHARVPEVGGADAPPPALLQGGGKGGGGCPSTMKKRCHKHSYKPKFKKNENRK